MEEYFLIAKIVAGSGNGGYVKIMSFSDFPERFFELSKVYIDFFGEKKVFFVEDVIKRKDFFYIKFRNFDSDSDTEVLFGKEIYVDSENVVELPENHYFIHDILGSKVIRNGIEFGIVKDVLVCPANDVYVIDNFGKEILIPAVKDYVESFDPGKKILVLKPGENLYEDDED